MATYECPKKIQLSSVTYMRVSCFIYRCIQFQRSVMVHVCSLVITPLYSLTVKTRKKWNRLTRYQYLRVFDVVDANIFTYTLMQSLLSEMGLFTLHNCCCLLLIGLFT